MLKKSTIQLLRFPFSWFLMPVFWFTLSLSNHIASTTALLVFFILHFLVYPSSNGYNSYMDKDTSSIGGIKHPPPPDKELFYVTIIMDSVAILLSFFISAQFAGLIFLYILFSRLYSYKNIRLKKYPIIGYLTVVLNQGGLIFFMIYNAVSEQKEDVFLYNGVVVACLLIGGFYPITQIYQHESDRSDNVKTLSMVLGIKGTFIFCGLMYSIAFLVLFFFFKNQNALQLFAILQIFFFPVIVYFFVWAIEVWKDSRKADFERTMKMNWIASTCTSLAFLTLLIYKSF